MKHLLATAALCILSLSGNLFAASPQLPDDTELLNIQKNLVPFKTITLEYDISESHDSGKTWRENQKFRTKFDREKQYAYLEETATSRASIVSLTSPEKSKQDIPILYRNRWFAKDGVLTFVAESPGNPEFSISAYRNAGIEKRETLDTRPILSNSTLSFILSYNSHSARYPLFMDGKISYRDPLLSYEQFNGAKVLKLQSTTKKERGTSKYSYIFDLKTGLLLEKTTGVFQKKGDALEEKVYFHIVPKDYFFSNGVPFPGTLTITSGNGEWIQRITINKTATKINEPIPESDFTPVFPPETNVTDKINRTNYTTPKVGTLDTDEKTIKKLDSLFEKENN